MYQMSTKLIRKNAVRMHFRVSVYQRNIAFSLESIISAVRSNVAYLCHVTGLEQLLLVMSIASIVVVRRDQVMGEW